ncbi:MAG: hypothetical protein GY861_19090 [bacterium]|nr:hypothetical protein [bacterium]
MDLKKEYYTDKEKEEKGIWEDFGNGCRVLIARSNNPTYKEYFKRISKPYRKQILRGTLPEEKGDALMIKAMAKAIILDWENLMEDGAKVEYNLKEAIRVLTKYPDFKDAVSEVAQTAEAYKVDLDEEEEENL